MSGHTCHSEEHSDEESQALRHCKDDPEFTLSLAKGHVQTGIQGGVQPLLLDFTQALADTLPCYR